AAAVTACLQAAARADEKGLDGEGKPGDRDQGGAAGPCAEKRAGEARRHRAEHQEQGEQAESQKLEDGIIESGEQVLLQTTRHVQGPPVPAAADESGPVEQALARAALLQQ